MLQQPNRMLHFAYAWPVKSFARSKRKPVLPPFPDAEPWQCNVYYYWWEYLRRHVGYQKCCERGGTGQYSKLYADLGNVHDTDFWSWWRNNNYHFAEPAIRQVGIADNTQTADLQTLLIQVPLENALSISSKQFKRLIVKHLTKSPRGKEKSRAKYSVATKPVLPALHEHLLVWDAKKDNPNIPDAEIADLVGLRINQIVDGETLASRKSMSLTTTRIDRVLHRRKQLAVQRHYRIATQYIDNVVKGTFPLRYKR